MYERSCTENLAKMHHINDKTYAVEKFCCSLGFIVI